MLFDGGAMQIEQLDKLGIKRSKILLVWSSSSELPPNCIRKLANKIDVAWRWRCSLRWCIVTVTTVCFFNSLSYSGEEGMGKKETKVFKLRTSKDFFLRKKFCKSCRSNIYFGKLKLSTNLARIYSDYLFWAYYMYEWGLSAQFAPKNTVYIVD